MENDEPNNAQKPTKTIKSRAGLSLKRVNLDKKFKQLLVIFDREVTHLLTRSHKELIGKLGINSLRELLEIYKEFKRLEIEKLEGMTTEELEKLAKEQEQTDTEEIEEIS